MSRQVIYSLLLLLVLAAMTGCSSGKAVGLAAPGLTKEEVNRRHVETIENNTWMQLQDDIDAVFLFDRPGRLNRLSVR
jgi:hypothetical protein